jgi:hypothetical protein
MQLPPSLPGGSAQLTLVTPLVLGTQETGYLAKLSSEPGASGATAEAESENTSTSSPPPEEEGGPVGAGGVAPRPSRSADGEGVDCNRKEGECQYVHSECTVSGHSSMCHGPPSRPPHPSLCPFPQQARGGPARSPEAADQQIRADSHF